MTESSRRDPLTGREAVIVGARQHRPNLPAGGCPFCPGGLEAPAPYDARWFVNRWPPMPDARCEIVLYAPDHDASLASIGVAGATRVIDLWAERTAALGARPDVAYVLVFENRGADVGATIAHPHGQIYAFDHVPDAPRAELATDDCALCAGDGDVLVSRRGQWRTWVPNAAAWPYELRLAPDDHVPDLTDARAGRTDLAAALVDALARLDQRFDAPMPYMLWVHQRPVDGGQWPGAHVHVHVAPLFRAPGTPRFVAAGELGSGVFFNPVEPDRAAAELRGLPGA
jgi:UDPglucose--hexose-1-phosphate uridylyltransferase